MKHSKLIKWLAAASLGICAAAFSAGMTADAATGTGITPSKFRYSYDTETGEATITGYSGTSDVLMIPAVAGGYTVTKIGSFAFEGGHYVSAYVPTTIQSIGYYAFSGTDLTSISLPASVTLVDQRAFYNCRSLTSVIIKGPAVLKASSFADCTALTSVKLADSSQTYFYFNHQAFSNNPNLYTVNGVSALSYQTDSEGRLYPVLNPAITAAVRNHFSRSIKVGFVDEYCTALCNYIVETETDPWMCDALKARQLHDWLIRHCEYEDCLNGERTIDNENHVASSVFLSYAINVRGQGIGETVCDGYAKAYTMLLAAAGIESYHIGTSSHAWNLVKIGDKYYHVDVTWDDHTNGTQYGTMYNNFLKSGLHGATCTVNHPSDHPLLQVYNNNVSTIVNNCTESYPDANGDGILDGDFDLDGVAGNPDDPTSPDYYDDILARFFIAGNYQHFVPNSSGVNGYTADLTNVLQYVLYHLHQSHTSFWNHSFT